MVPFETKALPVWERIPLYVQIVLALTLAASLGILLSASQPSPIHTALINNLAIPSNLILKALRALATPLIFLAILHAFLTAEIPGKSGRRLAFLLLTNTTVAILIGLLVANVLQPGKWGHFHAPQEKAAISKAFDPWSLITDSVPDSVIKPLVDNNVLQLIFVALAFGVMLRALKTEQIASSKTDYLPIEQAIAILLEAVMGILKWVIVLVPLAVFGIVAKTIALHGFSPFKSLGAFIVAVLIALLLQSCYYLMRLYLGSWVSPQRFLVGASDALFTAFSTASSNATVPVTFKALLEKVGLQESSASLGVLVGSNFNNDGTALYEAMSALFVTQILGLHLTLAQQFIVVLTSIFASVGAAGIPEAGLVTMTLVFTAVGLPTQYIVLLITVDWFLDRCRTTINVMGDMTISCLLDGKKQHNPVKELL
ncbi:dicarboxylate/amino acid:cation symporter [Aetokthonos hydrillicola Thurmond2011]|jgi:DAACS family dicarboxylate/amino acid:cation (Na+ or H+) symporter|uniref:Dicarboxylate/amino acid:cation symporter n=1 Tax=Aetokthonos hydrillicola Thurmond2011 TaxID=2712845 RepID=A0AAP5M6B0_9CYAN|nr:dicarboxylate/amino acid:cation symporter [Aetokthonos hydrillicola]MBO3458267.1 dicarboxylate/amino acid:cation symporter [Aetokthonos hydrillicola CCALA 1050]MBW4586729.1 dicarboxylate/amino acid:cation symporter [Aetokthonos hydrillicola CCALA 1050]MDR9893945.1 dicarboxylate/amino acid:cation symporter [Aetokthonos hydrillicola Thurmond2011]